MSPKKDRVEKFKAIVNRFFKDHGIKSPSSYLARRGGISRVHMYHLYKCADEGVGVGEKELDARTACWFLQQAEDVLMDTEIYEPTTIEIFLRPKLEQFYQEQSQ